MRNILGARPLSAFYNRFLPGLARSAGRVLSIGLYECVDYSKSRAYVLGHTIPFGAVYLNYPPGTEAYTLLKEEICRRLAELGAELGEDIAVQIYDGGEVYHGRYAGRAPDLIFSVNNFACVVKEDDISEPIYRRAVYSTRHTGSHRMDGVFLARGPDIKKNFRVENLSICDVAPAVLHVLGWPVPADMDGRVPVEIFKPGSASVIMPGKSKATDCERTKIRSKIAVLKEQGKI